MPRFTIIGVPMLLSSPGDAGGAVYRAQGKQQVTRVMGRGGSRGVYRLYAYSWFSDNINACVEKLEGEGYVVKVAEFSQIMEKGRDLANNGIWVRLADAPPKVSVWSHLDKVIRRKKRGKTKGKPKIQPSIASFRKGGRR